MCVAMWFPTLGRTAVKDRTLNFCCDIQQASKQEAVRKTQVQRARLVAWPSSRALRSPWDLR
jgi:hypothetical protein